MRKFIVGISVLCLIGTTYIGCKHELYYPGENGSGGNNSKPPDPTPSCSPDSVYFVNTVLPILTSNCAMSGCHDAASHQEGLVLNTYSGIMKIVNAGNAGGSKLVSVITTTNNEDKMPPPPAVPLSSSQIDAIKKWINQGARNNNCASCDTSLFTYSGAVKVIMTNKCNGCHTGASAGAGLDLTTYNGVKAAISNGRLLGSIMHSAGYVAMPQGGYQLPECEITQIQKWINAGAPNN